MLPISALPRLLPRRLRGLLFDLDDTLLDHSRLSEAAYSALFRLREAGFECYAVTGRPAGWAAVIVNQWPIQGAVAENGAIAFYSDEGGLCTLDPVPAAERRRRQQLLSTLYIDIQNEFPELVPSDDMPLRRTDVTFDIGEHQLVPRDRVAELRRFAEARGASTLASSVHVHVSFDRADKAAGVVRLIQKLSELDPTAILSRYAFIGDSENDASCFAAFRHSIGVRNLSGRPTVMPRFITTRERGAGFVEAAHALIEAGVAPASALGL
ncbi:MAG TPA: HAD hydrolase family protein [Polyangiaceae bacterium]|nr:HAD hydrolase family protein [Polyangiaceae bacterium]